jgi:hypothetical protein
MHGDCKPGFQPLRANDYKTKAWSIVHKFKTPLAPVHKLNHGEYVLQKLKDEINAFGGMLPRLDTGRAVLSAVGSMPKGFLVQLHCDM